MLLVPAQNVIPQDLETINATMIASKIETLLYIAIPPNLTTLCKVVNIDEVYLSFNMGNGKSGSRSEQMNVSTVGIFISYYYNL